MSHTQTRGPAGAPSDRSHISLGLVSIGTGLLAGCYAWQYGVGTATEMGPGFFPLMVSVLLAGLGGLLILRQGADLPPRDNVEGMNPQAVAQAEVGGVLRVARVLGSVLGGILVFALAIRPLGLFLSVLLLSAIASLGHPGIRLRSVLALSIALAAAATLIFVIGLKLNLNAMPDLF